MEIRGNANKNQRKREMEMKTLPVILVGLMACLAIGVTTAQGQQYTLQDLGVVKDMEYSVPAAIDSQGYVTGTAYKGEESCAFYYDYLQKFMEDAGGFNSRGFGISSTSSIAGGNLVVGDTFPIGPMEPRSHAAIFKGGYVVDLGVLPGQVYSRANGVNAIGQVVGFSSLQRDSSESRAFLWTAQGGMFDIGTLGGAYAQANAINDVGFITGTAQIWAPGPVNHAFIYSIKGAGPAAMRDLGVLGGLSSYGTAINNHNHVVGYSTIKPNEERVHAFLHDGNKMIDLGSLGASGQRWGSDLSVALAINNLDQVVGYSFLPVVGEMPIQQVAFLWTRNSSVIGGGTMVNLNKLVANGTNYLLTSATAINDKGQIVASAYDLQNGTVHAILLTPMAPTLAK
jgi:probable HAF family extracellular repeat protein